MPNPDNEPCEFTGVAAASTWYFWVERLSTSDCLQPCRRRWYAGGNVGSAFRRQVAELRERAITEGFEIVVWSRGAPLPAAATVVASEDQVHVSMDGTSMTLPSTVPPPSASAACMTSMTLMPSTAPPPSASADCMTLMTSTAPAPAPPSEDALVPYYGAGDVYFGGSEQAMPPPDLIMSTLAQLLRERPILCSEFNARLPIGYQITPLQLAQSSQTKPEPPLGTIQELPAKFSEAASRDVLHSWLDRLETSDLSAPELQLLRAQCTPDGVEANGCVIRLFLNAPGTGSNPKMGDDCYPPHLAGKCWRETTVVAPRDYSWTHPGYGQKILAMLSGESDTLLVRAARCGREATMQTLIEIRADISTTRSGYGETPLFAACLQSQIGAVRILCETAEARNVELDLSVHRMTSLSVLQAAVTDFGRRKTTVMRFNPYNNHMDPVYEQGAFDHIGDDVRVTKHAAQYAVVEYLLNTHGITWWEMELISQTCSQNGHGHHPIDTMLRMEVSGHVASSKWRVKLVELLLEKGFDPNVHVWNTDDHWGDHYCSVLHRACLKIYGECWRHSSSEYHMVRLLLQGKGDPTILNSYGESPIQYAQRMQLKDLCGLLGMFGQFHGQLPSSSASSSASSSTDAPTPVRSLSVAASAPQQALPAPVGKQRATPILTRALKVGVELLPIPLTPAGIISSEERMKHKRQKHAIQQANHKKVSRAEASFFK